mgnify:CR=1 FL=1
MANVARFFYFYDITGEHRRPVVTVCRLRSDEGTYGYGWAVCSDSDSPCKRTGRAIAEGRARAALKHQKYSKGRLHGELDAFVYAPRVLRLSALNVLSKCGLFPLNSRHIKFGICELFVALPMAMQPLDEDSKGQYDVQT